MPVRKRTAPKRLDPSPVPPKKRPVTITSLRTYIDSMGKTGTDDHYTFLKHLPYLDIRNIQKLGSKKTEWTLDHCYDKYSKYFQVESKNENFFVPFNSEIQPMPWNGHIDKRCNIPYSLRYDGTLCIGRITITVSSLPNIKIVFSKPHDYGSPYDCGKCLILIKQECALPSFRTGLILCSPVHLKSFRIDSDMTITQSVKYYISKKAFDYRCYPEWELYDVKNLVRFLSFVLRNEIQNALDRDDVKRTIVDNGITSYVGSEVMEYVSKYSADRPFDLY